MIREKESKTAGENKELCKVIAEKEAKALSTMGIIQEDKRVNHENNNLHQKMPTLEKKIKDNMNSLDLQTQKIKS